MGKEELDKLCIEELPSDIGTSKILYYKYGHLFKMTDANGLAAFNGIYWVFDKAAENKLTSLCEEIVKYRNDVVSKELIKSRMELKNNKDLSIKDQDKLKEYNKRLEKILKENEVNSGFITRVNKYFMKNENLLVDISEFDGDKLDEYINVQNGIVNLRTLELLPHSHEFLFTYCINIPFDKNAKSSLWETQLKETIGNYNNISDFIQTTFGYFLTGYTNLNKCYILSGKTRSGKGTLVNTIETILTDNLCNTLPTNSLTRSRAKTNDQGFDVAELKNKRVAFVSELENDISLNSSVVKTLTSDEKISAAVKYKNPFTFKPKFKIIIHTNFEIVGDLDDDAFWERLVIIDFPNSYKENPDTNRKSELLSEENKKGILTWMIYGAYKFLQTKDIKTPKVILDTLTQMKDDQNPVKLFLESNNYVIDLTSTKPIHNTDFYNEFNNWYLENENKTMSKNTFLGILKSLGVEETSAIRKINDKSKRCILGITKV